MKGSLAIKVIIIGIATLCVGSMVYPTHLICGVARAVPLINSGETSATSGVTQQKTWIVDDELYDGDFTTIHDAVFAASPGETINVYSGTYIENVVVDKQLTIIGIDHEWLSGNDVGKPVVQSPVYDDCFKIIVDSVTIQGFSIIDGRAGIYIDSCSGNQILDNSLSGNEVGVWLYMASNTVIRNNIASHNYELGIYLDDSSSSGNTIEENRVDNNGNRGIWIQGDNNLIFNNYFNNGDKNAWDDGQNNVWNVNIAYGPNININGGDFLGGNWWSDFPYWNTWGTIYNPIGKGVVILPWHAYHVPGTAGSIDHHPLPGFEVLAFIAAFAVVLMVLRKRKIR